jgi:hypothetical protein
MGGLRRGRDLIAQFAFAMILDENLEAPQACGFAFGVLIERRYANLLTRVFR